ATEDRHSEHTQTRTHASGRRTKAHMKIATLNISGRGDISASPRNNKWNALHLAAKEQKLGIIALQESHLDETHIQRIHDMYGRRLHIVNSKSERGTEAEGVAFVLNRELIDISNIRSHQIIPGRALYLRIKWHGEETLTLLNVYAPNARSDNASFWEEIKNKLLTQRLKKPDILLGDFNLVEEAIDRLPVREDENAPITALKTLLRWLELIDGWRISEPDTKEYTYPQRGAQSKSRIDRIYVSPDILQASNEWEINTTAIPTDHKIAAVKISTENAPYVGRGRWIMPAHLMLDQEYVKQIIELGRKAIEEAHKAAGQLRTTDNNPQKILKRFKKDATKQAKDRIKRRIPVMKAAIRTLKANLKAVRDDPEYTKSAEMQSEA
ncbi:hypothetical protein FOMPIDRAFT_1080763, partial [Fomitopsis schrenkii]